ncbi:unnamed protein product [Pocillopora meandrina]|uniref:BAP29/BAP31 transmembrane domain-containing protein n=1 Tax=Pocillopora meandrina TaxID=46732 RepID=A0AAU9WFF4_9CNID|nr:unnamed protein product [Pocillopora meandrina]
MAKMNLFHAQRNLYISGFSLILLIVLRRNVARLLSEVETGKKDEDKVNQEHKELRETLEDKSKELSERSEEGKTETKTETKDEDKMNQELKELREALEDKSKKLSEQSEGAAKYDTF